MGMHYSTNRYNMEASYKIAGSCAGSSCCQTEVCSRCTRHETRCSRRRSLSEALSARVLGTGAAVAEEEEVVLRSRGNISSVLVGTETVTRQREASPHDDDDDDEASPRIERHEEVAVLSPRHEAYRPWDEIYDDDDEDEEEEEQLEEAPLSKTASSRQPLLPFVVAAKAARRRRLDEKSCRQVSVSYDCNCRCAVRVRARSCRVNCRAHWESLVPVRVTVPTPERGFSANLAASRRAAIEGFEELLAVNESSTLQSTPPGGVGSGGAAFNRTDAAAALEGYADTEVYSLPGYLEDDAVDEDDQSQEWKGTATAAAAGDFDVSSWQPHQMPRDVVTDGFSRIVTVVYDHGPSRLRALHNLNRPEFTPGAVSACFYEPDWDPYGPFVPREQLAFASEMGYRLWKWLLVLICAVTTVTWLLLMRQPNLLGGEEVISSMTVMDPSTGSVRHNYFGYAMF